MRLASCLLLAVLSTSAAAGIQLPQVFTDGAVLQCDMPVPVWGWTDPGRTVMVSFAERLDVAFGGAFVSRSPLAWVARNVSKPGRPKGECWVLHATPEWSAEQLEASPEHVAEQLLSAFADALGRALPPVAFRSAHRWRFARTADPLGASHLWDGELGLGVCGDWTHGSRVEDAYTSGEALARALVNRTKA